MKPFGPVSRASCSIAGDCRMKKTGSPGFADAVNLPVIGVIPRRDIFRQAEAADQTLARFAPNSEMARLFWHPGGGHQPPAGAVFLPTP